MAKVLGSDVLGVIKGACDSIEPNVRAFGVGGAGAVGLAAPAVAAIGGGVVAGAVGLEWGIRLAWRAIAAKRKRRAEEEKKVRDEADRVRREEEARAAALRKEEEERAKPKPPTPPSPAQVRQALRQVYRDLLRELDADDTLDAVERAAAKLRAKEKYLARLEDVL